MAEQRVNPTSLSEILGTVRDLGTAYIQNDSVRRAAAAKEAEANAMLAANASSQNIAGQQMPVFGAFDPNSLRDIVTGNPVVRYALIGLAVAGAVAVAVFIAKKV